MELINPEDHIKASARTIEISFEFQKKILKVLGSKDKEKDWQELRSYIDKYSLVNSSEYEGFCHSFSVSSPPGAPLYYLTDKNGEILKAPDEILFPFTMNWGFYMDSTKVNLEEYVGFNVRVHGAWDSRLVQFGLPCWGLLFFNVESVEQIPPIDSSH